MLASSTNITSGTTVTLSNITLSATGVYKIRVSAAPAHAASIGNYLVTAWDTTPSVHWLGLNEFNAGSIGSPFSTAQWIFTAVESSQIQLRLLAAFGGLGFRLTGPNGFIGFTDLSSDSEVITLPTSGTYTLSAFGSNGTFGNFAFELNRLNYISLFSDSVFQGTLLGSGQSQLFTFEVKDPGLVRIDLAGLTGANLFQFFGSFNAIPTRDDYQLSLFGGLGGSNSLLFDAQPGTYRFLLYSDLVNVHEDFTILVSSASLFASTVTPNRLGNSQSGTITVNGIGFDAQTDVFFVAGDGTEFHPTQTRVVSPTSIVLECDLPSWPVGSYDLHVTRDDLTVVESAAFHVTEGGEARLVTNLGIPVIFGRQDSTTIWIEYLNAGDVAMPVPQLQLGGSDKAILTLDPALNGRGLTTSTMPGGFASTVTFTASGKSATPGLIQPGEVFRVPVYYRGLLQPWNLDDTEITFSLGVQRAGETGFQEVASKSAPVVTSLPTDAMFGPIGLGLPNFLVARHLLPYRINFAN
ncbi:MAG: hypothetical protein ABI619_13065, partial [Betaproteobacteria bacterium]